MKYFLAPRSGEKSYKNYESTIKNGVPYDRIEPYLSEEGRKVLFEEEVIYAWGNREGTSAHWREMSYGDQVIFYAKKELVMVGEVYYKHDNPDLALAMWPRDENGKPWRFTFFITNLRYIKVPIRAFNAIAGYDPKYIVQGFTQLKQERVTLIERQYGSVEQFIQAFETTISNEAPAATERLYVNIKSEVKPTIRNDITLTPKQFHEASPLDNKKKQKIDHLKKNKENAITGSKGEVLVLAHEKERLVGEGRRDLAAKVQRISLDDDAPGYDVLSYEKDGKERYIEVKSTGAKSTNIHFFVSANEMKQGKILANYYIYFVDAVSTNNPRITLIPDPINETKFSITPDTYIFDAEV